ncbi:Phospholipase sgr2 [Datura stramonium]|uniref:Phospholipase sgr2 n=1 Tax=Datura stramonium TaxID=4076 RepID=A0ABS8Y8H3_DATST|nr:Phospholipase sgr2 [Datura stramonium]
MGGFTGRWDGVYVLVSGSKGTILSSGKSSKRKLAVQKKEVEYNMAKNRRILRGQWFAHKGGLDWLPLREDVAEQLEFACRSKVWHRRTFQPSGLYAARVDMQGFTPGLHAIFTGEDDTWEAWLNADASGFSGAIGFEEIVLS